MKRPLRAGAIAVAALCAGCAADRSRVPAETPVVLVTIDTLRSDHLGVYGYAGGRTAAIDALARDAVVFDRAYAAVPLTLPSHATLMTGLEPPVHGVRNNIGYALDPRHRTLAATLAERGFATGGFVSAYVLRRATGIAQGFASFDDAVEPQPGQALGAVERAGSTTVAAAVRWLDGVGGRPFFLWVHLYEPHSPYKAPEPFASQVKDPYAAEIAAADAAVGELLGELHRRGLYDRSIVVVASDHGEGLGDHGEQEHGILLYREAIQVPLLFKLPGSKRGGERVAAPVGLVDVAPTIERLLSVPVPAGGRDLLAPRVGAGPVYSETYYPRIHLGWSELRSLVSGSFHYIASPAPELFALDKDASEKENVLESQRPTAFKLKNDLAAIPAAFEEPKLEASPEEVSRLAALGYLTAKAAPATGPLPDPKAELGALSEMTSAAELARAGRLAESAAKCRELLTRNPGFLDARLQLAWNLSQLGRFDEARREYAAVVERSPAHLPIVALDMARLELLAGDAAAAAAQAELAVTAFPDQARLLRGEAALARRDAAAALAEARALVAAAPTPPVAALILQARAEADLGDLTAALAHAQQAATADAASHEAPTPGVDAVLGDLLARSGRNAEAEAAFRREIARFPRSLDAYANLAILLAVEHRFAEVEATLNRLITSVPERRAFLLAARTAEDLGNRQLADTYRRRGEALR